MKSQLQKALFICTFIFSSFLINAQYQKTNIIVPVTGTQSSTDTNSRSPIQYLPLSNNIDTATGAKWSRKLIAFEKSHEAPSEMQTIINEKTELKVSSKTSHINKRTKTNGLAPAIESGFSIFGPTGYTPPDNTMAISKGGFIVASVNSNIEYYDTIGNVLYSANYDDFINDTSLLSLYFDPLIKYDSEHDRFILVILYGFNSTTTKVITCISKTNNPSDGWWSYYLPGNALNDSSWFDYPKLGFSNDDIFITGNLFTDENEYNQSVIYQLNKSNAYQGDTLEWAIWHNILGNPATIVPASYGQYGNYGPGIYLISSFSFDDYSSLQPYLRTYDITNNLSDTGSINYYSQPIMFGLAGNGMQLGSSVLLSNNDPRIQDAFYLNGKIQFTYCSEYLNGFAGLNYNKLTLSTMTNWSTIYGITDFECSFPSLASSGISSTDESVYLCFLKTGATIYPEARVINCDNAGQWTESSLMKEGENFLDYGGSTDIARWGDYSAICLRYSGSNPEIWANGCYANKKSTSSYNIRYLASWISKINGLAVGISDVKAPLISNTKVYPNPSTDIFKLEFTNEKTQMIRISVKDINGREVKLLFADKSKKGRNEFSFNRQALCKGIYFIIIETSDKKIAMEKIIVQ